MIDELMSYEYVMHLLLGDLEYTTQNSKAEDIEDDIRYYAYDYSYYISYFASIGEYENAASLRGALVLALMNYKVKISDAHKMIRIAIDEHNKEERYV